jgi:hypothetical protein
MCPMPLQRLASLHVTYGAAAGLHEVRGVVGRMQYLEQVADEDNAWLGRMWLPLYSRRIRS